MYEAWLVSILASNLVDVHAYVPIWGDESTLSPQTSLRTSYVGIGVGWCWLVLVGDRCGVGLVEIGFWVGCCWRYIGKVVNVIRCGHESRGNNISPPSHYKHAQYLPQFNMELKGFGVLLRGSEMLGQALIRAPDDTRSGNLWGIDCISLNLIPAYFHIWK